MSAPAPNKNTGPTESDAEFGGVLPTVLLAIAILGFITFVDYLLRLLTEPRLSVVIFAALSGAVLIFSMAIWKQKKIGVYGYVISILISFSLKVALGEAIGFSLWEPLSLPVLAAILRERWSNMT